MADSPPSHGARLRTLRVATGVSMNGLAEAAGCSYQHLRAIETRNNPPRRPSPELAARLATALSDASGRTVAVSEFYDGSPRRQAA